MEALAAADGVFVGVVRGAEKQSWTSPGELAIPWGGRVFRFEVLGAWKGVTGPEVLVRTGGGCGYDFMAGGVYLVYGQRVGTTDTLTTSICSRTRSLQEAEGDFAALGAPAFAPVDPVRWAAFRPPAQCPIHPQFPIRLKNDWAIADPLGEVDARLFAAHQSEFPYAALELDQSQRGPNGRTLWQSYVCAACREAAMQWCFRDGAPCPSWKESAIGSNDRRSRKSFSAAEYRRLHPEGNFAFLFDDGRRFHLDTIDGRLWRSSGTVSDTTIAFALADSTLHRLYELMITHRMFDREVPHPDYPAADRAGGPACDEIQLSVRSDTLVVAFAWNPALAPRVAAPGTPWFGLQEVARTVRSAIEAHPASRALPSLPMY